jgi:hypothetical protein
MKYSKEIHQLDLSAEKAVNGTYKMEITATVDGSEITASEGFTIITRVLPFVEPKVVAPVINVKPKEDVFEAPVEVVNLPEVDLSKYTYKQQADKKKREKPFEVKPTPMSDTGEIGLNFSLPARAPKDGKLPPGMNDAVVIEFIPQDDETAKTFGRMLGEEVDPLDHLEDKSHGFSWEVTSFTSEGLKFKFNFADPLKVSQTNSKPDKMKLSLKKDTFFSADPPYKALSGNINIDIAVPKQFANKLQSQLSAMIAFVARYLFRIAMAMAILVNTIVYISR